MTKTKIYSTIALVLAISTVVSGLIRRVDNSTGALMRDQTNRTKQQSNETDIVSPLKL